MFIPIRTDRRQQRTPWVTYGLLGLNVAIFLATARGGVAAVEAGLLVPTAPRWWQFVSYAFLHADIFHLGGNMLFLYVFGRPLEDRFRHVGFLAFYLAAGVLAGLGHCLTDSAPVLGASGAVAGVTGAFLALFPLSRITVVYWFIFVGAFEIAGLYLIVLQIFMNLFGLAGGGAGVAYTAHLAGYAVGFLVGIGLLATRLLPREPWDFLSMVAHRRRRAAFQRMARQGYHGWEKGTADALAAKGAAADPVDPTTVKLRREINQAVAEHDSATAGRVYRDLIDHDPDAVLAPAVQLDVANGLMSDGAHRAAAEAYRKLLDRYPAHPDRAEVELLLGRILGRYLDQPDQARELFESAAERTRDPDQRALARRFLAELDDGDDL